jgi:hypothetical protein
MGPLSGRLYMSFGQKLDFRLTTDGLVQPAPWAAGDPNHDILFDRSEFTLGRQRVIDTVKASRDFAKSVVTRSDGTVLGDSARAVAIPPGPE